jgi:hypothetical protein
VAGETIIVSCKNLRTYVIAKGEALKQSQLEEGISLTLTLSQRERENNNEIAEQEFILSRQEAKGSQ